MDASTKQAILDRVDERLKEMGVSYNQISLASGQNREWLGQLARTPQRWPAADALMTLAEKTGLRLNYLLTGRGPRLVSDPDGAADVTLVPKLSWVAASRFAAADGVAEMHEAETVNVPDLGPGSYFALDVVGDSMNRIAPEGSTIIVNRTDNQLVNRRFYVFSRNDDEESTFKRWGANPDRLEPYSTNTDHEPIFISEPIKVVGRVVRVITEL